MVRERRPDDASPVALVVSRALAADDGRPLPDRPSERATARWAERLADPAQWCLVEQAEERIVGVCHGAPERGAEQQAGHLTGLFVEPDEWGRGHGRALLKAAMERMRELGHREARLWTPIDNARSQALYTSEGWRPTGEQRGAADGRTEQELRVALA